LEKISGPLLLILVSALSFFFIKSVSTAAFFTTDNLLKLIQARSLLENDLVSDEILCRNSPLEEACRYLPDGFFLQKGRRIGPFPVTGSFVSALALKIGGPPAIVILSGVFLLMSLAILMFYSKLPPWISGLLLLITPLFFHYLDFPDVALSLFLFTAGFCLMVSGASIPSRAAGALLAAMGGWTRPEIFIITAFLLASILFFSMKSEGLKSALRTHKPIVLSFAIGVLTFLIFNTLVYGSPGGPRIGANQSGIFGLSLFQKAENAQSLLFYGRNRFGFFGYTPFFMALLIFALFYRKVLSSASLVFLTVILLSTAAIALLTPNDSNIDWGSRYLTGLVVPFAFLIKNLREEIQPGKRVLILFFVLSFISIFTARSYLKLHRDLGGNVTDMSRFYNQSNGNVWVFANNMLMNYVGPEIMNRPVLLVRNEEDSKRLALALAKCDDCKSVSIFFPGASFAQGDRNPFAPNPGLQKQILNDFSRFKAGSGQKTPMLESYTFSIK